MMFGMWPARRQTMPGVCRLCSKCTREVDVIGPAFASASSIAAWHLNEARRFMGGAGVAYRDVIFLYAQLKTAPASQKKCYFPGDMSSVT